MSCRTSSIVPDNRAIIGIFVVHKVCEGIAIKWVNYVLPRADRVHDLQAKVSVTGMRWFAAKLRNLCTTPPTGTKTRSKIDTTSPAPASPWMGAALEIQDSDTCINVVC